MKNQLILFCLFSLFLSSCKDDENVQPQIKQALQGTWKLPSVKNIFYDESDRIVSVVVYEQNSEVTFYGDSLKNSYPNADKHYYNIFSIYQKDGKNYLRVGSDLTYGDSLGYTDSEIRRINTTQMELCQDFRYDEDVDLHDGTTWRKARRREYIQAYTKK